MSAATGHDLGEIHSIGARTRELIVTRGSCPLLEEAGVQLCGLSLARPGFRFARAAPDMVQILACLDGGGEVFIDGGWTALGQGSAYVTPAFRPHAYRAVARRPWNLCWAILDADGPLGRACIATEPAILACDARPLADAVRNLHREGLGAEDAPVQRMWEGLVVALIRRALAPTAGDPRLTRLWEVVDANLSRPWTLTDLAVLAGLGPEALRRHCQAAHGASPMAWLTGLRMRRAHALLLASGLRVAQVAEAVGYQDPFTFSTAFKRVHGVAPSTLRRS